MYCYVDFFLVLKAAFLFSIYKNVSKNIPKKKGNEKNPKQNITNV